MAEAESTRLLEQRPWAAERVCGLVGITGADMVTERGKALTQAWMHWSCQYGDRAVRPSDAEIAELAAERDRIVDATLERIRAEYPEIAAHRAESGQVAP